MSLKELIRVLHFSPDSVLLHRLNTDILDKFICLTKANIALVPHILPKTEPFHNQLYKRVDQFLQGDPNIP